MSQTVNVTGRRLTSARTRFTIAGSASAKGFGDYGNCLTRQAAFTSGHLDREGQQNYESAEEPAPVEAVVVET